MSLTSEHGGSEDDQVLVAEFALDLLEGGERAAVARRIAAEPALRADLQLWRARLSSLDSEFANATPPAHVYPAIERRLFGEAQKAKKGGIFSWWSDMTVLRGMAVAGHVLAFVAIGYIFTLPRFDAQTAATQLVAALQANEGSGVEFVAFYDTGTQAVRLIGLQGAQVADKDYELWYIRGDEPAVSMGVIPVDHRVEVPLDASAKAKIGEGTVLAVTLEQKGGSPTGVAQGPIVAVGKALPI
jgi:anti-sigma-K factor RskA